jgi:uncharacterized membrane protein YbhN (UPF0104 family)
MLRKVLSITLLAAFLGWAAWYVRSNSQAFLPLLDVSARDGLLLALAFVMIMMCNGVFIAVVSQAFQIRLYAIEWMSLSFASSFVNYFLPFKGGVGIRALYMSRVHGLQVSKFVSTLGVMYLMHTVVNGLLALIGMGIVVASNGPAHIGLLIFFALLTSAGVIAMFVDVDIGDHHERFPMAQLASLLRAWRTVRRNRALLVKLWLLMLGLTLATIWQIRVAFDAVSISLPWSGVLVYAASKNLATLISLTPGSLGVVELISIYLGGALEYNTATALSVQGLIRAVAIIMLLVIGPAALWFLRRNLKMIK